MAQFIPVDCFDLVIYGGTGDLAMRKLLPALYHRVRDGQVSADSRIIAVGRSPMKLNAYRKEVEASVQRALGDEKIDKSQWRDFAARLHYVHADALDHKEWGELRAILKGYEDRIRVVYLATSPSLFGPIATGFRVNGLLTDDIRIVLEKPLGRDSESARKINDEVGQSFAENQVYRIDHYLGKETVQNLLALRFANSLFEPQWRRGVVDHVQITVAEDLGVGGRIEFYDEVGALRDMVQNHLMQLLCLVAMEAPASLEHESVRDEKLKVLRALRPITAEQVKTHTVRGQYAAGAIDGVTVPGYLEELESGQSNTETFVALKVDIENWRWSGVPFYLRTGKRMKSKHSEIIVQFQHVPHSIFEDLVDDIEPNRLTIRLQPDEGVKLHVMAKEPGPGGFDLRPVSLDLSFEETFGVRYPDAYERLLMEVLRGRPALFMRRDEVEAAWAWVDQVVAGWAESKQKAESYLSGSWGPTSSSLLMDRDGRQWHPES